MGEIIIDYYKNSKFYQNELIDLIPTNEDYLEINQLIKEDIDIFDELTFNKRKFISNNLSDILSVNEDVDYLSYSLLDENIEMTFSLKNNFFDITVFVDKANFKDDQHIFITHRFYSNKQELIIEEELSKGGYCGTINLNELSNCFKEKVSIDELNKIKEILSKFTTFMVSFYDNNKAKSLKRM